MNPIQENFVGVGHPLALVHKLEPGLDRESLDKPPDDNSPLSEKSSRDEIDPAIECAGNTFNLTEIPACHAHRVPFSISRACPTFVTESIQHCHGGLAPSYRRNREVEL